MKELTDIFAEIAAKMEIKFLFGPVDEVIQKLHSMSQTAATNAKRYPVLVLFTDIPEVSGRDAGIKADVTIPSVVIATVTKQNYAAEQRMEKVFKPTLIPLYEKFMNQLEMNTDVMTLSGKLIRHTRYLRFSWGKSALFTDRNAGSDFIDAIEIQNLQLSIYHKC